MTRPRAAHTPHLPPGWLVNMTYGSQMDKPKQNNKTLKRAQKQRPVEEVSVPPVDKGETVVLSTPQGREPCGQTKFCIREEFRGAQLGDKRLTDRLLESVEILATMPGQAFSAASQGNKAAIKGHYRMIDKPDESAITPEAILAPHRQRTLARMREHETVLCIQDGCELNYSGLTQCEGLGQIGTNQTGASSAGLHLHSTLAVGTDGVPLGVLRAAISAPLSKSADKRKRQDIPIEERKTFAWIEGLRDCVQASAQLGPTTRQVCVMDREADFFDLFDEPRNNKVDLLVRAKHDRVMGADKTLFEHVRQSTVQGTLEIMVPRQSTRAKKSKQKASNGHGKRTAQVGLRYQQIQLRAPEHLKDRLPATVWVVHVQEQMKPDDDEPLEWFLLSTQEIATHEQAQECLRWYALRWRIEDWHRVLKTGCRIESLQHQNATRLKRALCVHLVIAWRIMLMTLLGRQSSELPAEILFTDIEINVLTAYAKKKAPALVPGRLNDAVRLVARLGGYIERGKQPPPGHQIIWRGYALLQTMCEAFSLLE